MPTALLAEFSHVQVAPEEQPGLCSWPTLLVVDSDLTLVRSLVRHFERRGYHVAAAASLAEARGLLDRRSSWTAVIAECHLPDGSGLDLQGWLTEKARQVPFLLLASGPAAAAACAGVESLAKPFSLPTIEARVNRLTRR
jgi:two-component system response regulator RegA